MMKKLRLVLGASAALLLLSGCGTDAAAPDSSTQSTNEAALPTSESAAPQVAEASEPEARDYGHVTVDGVTHVLGSVRACDPLNEGLVERELELQGLGTSNGSRIQLDVYVQKIAGQQINDVAWSGPEGVFGNPRHLKISVDETESRISGSAALHDAQTQEQLIDIEFNMPIPSETVACR